MAASPKEPDTDKLTTAIAALEPSQVGRGHPTETPLALARAAAGKAPRKGFYRVRAHLNPLSTARAPRPLKPEHFAWDELFTAPGGDLAMPSAEEVARIRWPTDEDKRVTRAEAPGAASASASSSSSSGAAAAPAPAGEGDEDDEDGETEQDHAAAAAAAGVASMDESSWACSHLAGLPAPATPAPVDIVDVGAGFGGLLFGLNLLFPGARKLAMEIRPRVAEFVRLKVLASRAAGDAAAERCAVLRVNAMRQLPCFLPPGSVSAFFVCFPDPHFKRQNHRRRIVSPSLLTEYAAALRVGGVLFTITDVPKLHDWMREHLEEHPSFAPVHAAADDPCVIAMRMATDEARKSLREGREHQWNAYRRVSDAEADAAAAAAGPFFGGYSGGVAVPRSEAGTNDAPEMFNWSVREREARAKRTRAGTPTEEAAEE